MHKPLTKGFGYTILLALLKGHNYAYVGGWPIEFRASPLANCYPCQASNPERKEVVGRQDILLFDADWDYSLRVNFPKATFVE